MKTIEQIIERLMEPTPAFFKLIQKIGASVAVLIAFIMGLPTLGIVLPGWVDKFFNVYTLIMPLIPVVISQLASIWRKPDGSVDQKKKYEYLEQKAKE